MLLQDGEILRVGVDSGANSAWLETRCSFGVQLAKNGRMLNKSCYIDNHRTDQRLFLHFPLPFFVRVVMSCSQPYSSNCIFDMTWA